MMDRLSHVVSPVSFALLAAIFAPAWAQRAYQGVPVVKEGTTIRISQHVYVIPDVSARGVPNVGIVVGDRASLVVDPGMGPTAARARCGDGDLCGVAVKPRYALVQRTLESQG